MADIELESIGKLKSHPHVPEDWLISRCVPVPFFDYRELAFTLDADLKNDKTFLPEADQAIKNFLAKESGEKFNYTDEVFENYREFSAAVDEEILRLNNKSEIWRYVYPSAIYVNRRHRRDRDIYLQIHCECEWEIEHGLQIVFRQGKKITRVSSIDGHLTEADAYDKPDADDELLSGF